MQKERARYTGDTCSTPIESPCSSQSIGLRYTQHGHTLIQQITAAAISESTVVESSHLC